MAAKPVALRSRLYPLFQFISVFIVLIHFRSVSSSSAAIPSASSASGDRRVNPTLSQHFSHPLTHRVSAYGKYKFDTRPKHVEHNGMRMQVIDAPLSGCPSLDFNVDCTIGGQSFACELDTGSTTLAVAANGCQSSSGGCAGITNLYSPGTTSTVLSSQDMTSLYGDGSGWRGDGVSDMVSVGGSQAVSLTFATITSQNHFFVEYTCPIFQQGPSADNAILGFGGNGLAVRGAVSHVQTQQWFGAYQRATSTPNLFTIRMCQTTGDLWLGGYDSSSFTDQIHWANLVTGDGFSPGNGYYSIDLQSIGVVGGQTDSSSSDFGGSVLSIVDSGTTEAIIPSAVYNNILNALNGVHTFSTMFGVSPSSLFSSGNCYPSSTNLSLLKSRLPQVTLTIGAAMAGVPAVQITLNGLNFYLQKIDVNSMSYYCASVSSNAEDNSFIILGWSFMNQLIVAHDLQNTKIGFAPRASGGCVDGSPGAISVSGGAVGIVDASGATGQSASSTTTTTTTTTPRPSTGASSTTTTSTTSGGTTHSQTTTRTTTTTTTQIPLIAPSNSSMSCGNYKCLNGGTCQPNWFGLATCSCSTNFSGSHCQSPRSDACAVCQNGGSPNSACSSCICPAGFAAADCSVAFARIALTLIFSADVQNIQHNAAGLNVSLSGVISALQGYLRLAAGYQLQLEASQSASNKIQLTVDLLCSGCSQAQIQTAAAKTVALSSNASLFASMNSNVVGVSALQVANSPNGCLYAADGSYSCSASSSDSSSSFFTNTIVLVALAVGAFVLVSLLALSIFLCYRCRHVHRPAKVPQSEEAARRDSNAERVVERASVYCAASPSPMPVEAMETAVEMTVNETVGEYRTEGVPAVTVGLDVPARHVRVASHDEDELSMMSQHNRRSSMEGQA